MLCDACSVKSSCGGDAIGFDGGKKVHGRKRQLVTDTLVLLWAADAHSAQVHDSRGALDVIKEAVAKLCRVFKMYVDSAYHGDVSSWLEAHHIEVVIPSHLTPGFTPQAQRWVVERTIAWLTRLRRLAKDFEKTVASSIAMTLLGGIRIACRRL